MIDVASVLRSVPVLKTFCSVGQLETLVENLRSSSKAAHVEVAGTSEEGRPIYHVRFGSGATKALVVAFPHVNEVIGGLTVYSLMSLLRDGHPALVEADVEWHVVPCIDPDGALLNEGWSQKEFQLVDYLKHFHKQEPCDQAELSFPLHYRRMSFSKPTREATVLRELLERIRPDFYYSLHNAWAGGTYYLSSRNIDARYQRELLELLTQEGVDVQETPFCSEGCARFGSGLSEVSGTRKTYDALAATMSHPEEVLNYGACSWEYLQEIKPEALTFVAEVPYVSHPDHGSMESSGESVRRLRLRLDADMKFLAAEIIAEWEQVEADLDATSPFYKKIYNGVISQKAKLLDGLPSSPYKTRDLLLGSSHGGVLSRSDRLNEHMLGFYFLCNAHEFVRLLKVSRQSAAVKSSIARMERVVDEMLQEFDRAVGLDAFQPIECQALARVQLGAGLIAMNSILSRRA